MTLSVTWHKLAPFAKVMAMTCRSIRCIGSLSQAGNTQMSLSTAAPAGLSGLVLVQRWPVALSDARCRADIHQRDLCTSWLLYSWSQPFRQPAALNHMCHLQTGKHGSELNQPSLWGKSCHSVMLLTVRATVSWLSNYIGFEIWQGWTINQSNNYSCHD